MKTITKIFLFSLIASMPQQLIADHIISFFLRPFPHLPKPEQAITPDYADRKSKKLQRPEKLAQYRMRAILASNQASGLYCTYKGQLAVSDYDGHVTFSRHQVSYNVHILVAKRIDPIIMSGQTLHHWELEKGYPAALYFVEMVDDTETEIEVWRITKKELPENRRLSLDTIVIFAPPGKIIVPEGITRTQKTAQLILPDMYVKKGIDKILSSLHILNIKRFFSQTREIHKINKKQFIWQLH